MKRLYALLTLVIVAVISLNMVVMYLMISRPTKADVQKMVDVSVKSAQDASLDEITAKAVAELPKPEKGDTGATGTSGSTGKTGQSIVGPPGPTGPKGDSVVGPKGDKGDIGQPGREVELSKDPDTGDLYMRYSGDTAWTLVGAPNGQ